jgi:hypothetical protein
MSKLWVLIVGPLVVLALLVAGGVWLAWPKKNTVTIEVFPGTPGVAFHGTADVDGVSRELTGTVPDQFVLEGYRITYSLTSGDEAGEFRVKATIGGVAIGSSGSGNPPTKGVRGWVKSNWGWSPPDHWIESFGKDADTGWMSPPP